jgi:hypothetical protein
LRERKVALIRNANPTWEDLGEQWFRGKDVKRITFEDTFQEKAGPSLRSG